MSGTTTIAQYKARINAMQEECIPGSKAYPGVSIKAEDAIYWTNGSRGLVAVKQDPAMSTCTRTYEMTLCRNAPIGSGEDFEYEALCEADELAVVEYFNEHPSLTTSTLGILTDIVPKSARVVSLGVRAIERADGLIWGSVYTLTFSFNRKHFPRG